MLLHLMPSYYLQYKNVSVCLKSFEIPELNVILTNNELATRNPFPNKNYNIACNRKETRKAMIGFIIETDNNLRELTLLSKWEISLPFSENKLATHESNVRIIDNNFPLISQFTQFADAMGSSYTRIFDEINYPEKQLSVMLHCCDDLSIFKYDSENISDDDKSGIFVHRKENIYYPTIEIERYKHKKNYLDRLPDFDKSFKF